MTDSRNTLKHWKRLELRWRRVSGCWEEKTEDRNKGWCCFLRSEDAPALWEFLYRERHSALGDGRAGVDIKGWMWQEQIELVRLEAETEQGSQWPWDQSPKPQCQGRSIAPDKWWKGDSDTSGLGNVHGDEDGGSREITEGVGVGWGSQWQVTKSPQKLAQWKTMVMSGRSRQLHLNIHLWGQLKPLQPRWLLQLSSRPHSLFSYQDWVRPGLKSNSGPSVGNSLCPLLSQDA